MMGQGSRVPDAVLLIAVGSAIVFAHRDAVGSMIDSWNSSPMYSYGFTVPAISAFLVWSRREQLAVLNPQPSWLAGGALTLVAVAMTVAARAGGIQVLEQLAFVVSITAGVLLVLGGAYAKVAWASIAYLVLMVPVWDGLTEPLHQGFQLRSATIGVWILQTLGIPAYRDGTTIALPGLVMEVARACSGVNYLVAVMALGLPLTYLYLPDVPRRALLLVSALVVAALSNGLRVALIGVLVHLEIGSPLHGPFHTLHGLFVAAIGYVVLFAGLRVLRTQSGERVVLDACARVSSISTEARWPAISRTAAAACIALFVLLGSNMFSRTPQAVALDRQLSSSFPHVLGDWTSAGAVPDVLRSDRPGQTWPGADEELHRRFVRSDGAFVDVYVGYFAWQQQRKEIVNYRAADLHRRATRLDLPGAHGGTLTINYGKSHGPEMPAVFWYQLGASPEADLYMLKARTLWNATWRGTSQGAVVLLTAPNHENPSADELLRELAPLVADALASRLPGG